MNIGDICVVILTKNESSNIRRTLSRLQRFEEVVIVDSYSDDDTLDIAAEFSNVRLGQRSFDQHAIQWNYGVRETGITRRWILALDADYLVTEALVSELENLELDDKIVGYRANFVYCVDGKPLRGSLYPSNIVLFQKDAGEYFQDGHTQRHQKQSFCRAGLGRSDSQDSGPVTACRVVLRPVRQRRDP